eukprot:gene2622-3819_t
MSERGFSSMGRIVAKLRSKTHPETAGGLLFLKKTLNFVQEKNKQIASLQQQIAEIKRQYNETNQSIIQSNLKLKQSFNKIMNENKNFQNEILRLTSENEKLKGKNEELTNITNKFFMDLQNQNNIIVQNEEPKQEVKLEDEKKTRLKQHLNCLIINEEDECKKIEEKEIMEKENLQKMSELKLKEDENIINDKFSPPKIKKLKKI